MAKRPHRHDKIVYRAANPPAWRVFGKSHGLIAWKIPLSFWRDWYSHSKKSDLGKIRVQKKSLTRPLSPALLKAEALGARFLDVRTRTQQLSDPVSAEDAQLQSMTEVSPTKWHMAHTSWFFETFILRALDPSTSPFDPDFHYLFNSYYEAKGPRHPRDKRGMISRPRLARVCDYRKAITDTILSRLDQWANHEDWPQIAGLIELGCHHEEQHQELLLTDIKHVLSCNPTDPGYASPFPKPLQHAPDMAWQTCDEQLVEIGHDGEGFAYDNEGPQHKYWLHAHALATRPVTNGDWCAFMEDGGYDNPRLWLSDGWAWVNNTDARAPLYWQKDEDDWTVFTLYGRQPVNRAEPVSHINLYEADAFATWAGARLPTEHELEHAARQEKSFGDPNMLESRRLHPAPAAALAPEQVLHQLKGDVWEWTQSAYNAYPGYKIPPGAVGEYNGKFMCSQYVLRGGSCVTPRDHWRVSYRNFFPAPAQWQFSGLRLAKDI